MRRSGSFRSFSLFLVLLGTQWARGSEIHVPNDQPTIGAAIVAANVGDSVIVATGTYAESIDFLGKAITVTSESGPAITRLVTTGFDDGVRFVHGETATSRLVGFRLTNPAMGAATKIVRIANASPTIEGCEIANCVYTVPTCPYIDAGVLVRVDGGSPRFVACEFRDNEFHLPCSETVLRGSVLAANSATVTLEECLVQRNRIFATSSSAVLDGALVAGGSLTVVDCTIEDNDRGGVDMQLGSLSVVRSTLRRNGSRPAIRAFSASTATIERCEITENPHEGFVLGRSLAAHVDHCTFAANGSSASPFDLSAESNPLAPWTGSLVVSDSIVFGGGIEAELGAFGTTVGFSDVVNGFAGMGNISLDPMFLDPASHDFRLAPGSPCIDAADPNGEIDPDGTRGDMGAYAYDAWTIVEAGDAGSLVGEGSLHPNSAFEIGVVGAPARTGGLLLVAASMANSPVGGATLVPGLPAVFVAFETDALGGATFQGRWPKDSTARDRIVTQAAFPSQWMGGSCAVCALSDGLVGIAP